MSAAGSLDQAGVSPRVRVFHGTRRSIASAIREEGFRPMPVLGQVAEVAEAHGVPVERVLDELRSQPRYVVLDERDGQVSFTPSNVAAARWANRGPEATWEALWSVYRLRHPELGADWNQSDEAHLWVLAQRLEDPPVVATIEVDAERLWMPRNGSSAAELLASDTAHLFERCSEWRMEAGTEVEVVSVDPAPIQVDASLARFMSGNDPEDFAAQVDGGQWGPIAGEHPIEGPWFEFDQIWSRLNPERRRVLEELAGTPIPSPDGPAA